MLRSILCSTLALVAGATVAAHADPKDDLAAAVAKLGAAANYSWTTTTAATGNFTPGPVEGKTEKDAITSVTSSFQDTATTIYIKGAKAVVKTDSGYQTTDEIQAAAQNGGGGFSPAMFAVFTVGNLKLPAEQTKDWSGKLKNLALADGVYTADLDEESAKALMSFGRGRGRGAAAPADAPPAPTIKNPKGSVKIWITDGAITKYEVHFTGAVTFNDNDIDIDRTTTTEIKNVGSTKVDVPDDAKAKLNG